MKKINSLHIARFLQVAVIAYLVFVLLADIMKWQQLDQTRVTLAICAIAVTTGSLKKLGGRKESKVK
ncbi:hypothetical protein HO757_00370 [Streptococcus suis]|uniref:Membrane protein n=1 Tax=Streptococcus suis TaxID=1307 RepID=A0A123UZG5_STRSU|nr:hypothetical protein [Streptococcus suis]NQN59205.1 hypothetical protein [Streptococcus suis]NQP75342.1 hypothetical protein [Streptococcus suis]NQP77371.1 hypothetical protein [Streptococcus suis]NQP91711.1 hypothetical protein [Streptococcus suis]NQP93666.1 hypothetical protein [Streptococcus suis]